MFIERKNLYFNAVIQLVEYWNHNPKVKGSNPFFVNFEKMTERFKVLVC